MDHQVAIKLSIENDNIEIQSPEPLVTNDGSNACAFLSVKIADTIIHELGAHISDIASIAEMIEEVIWFLPQKINGKRDMTRFYDVSEAYSILWKATVLNSEYDFFEELPFADCIYSFDSRRRLHERLCILGQADFTAIFSSVPYILVIACIGGRALIIDTHTGSLIVGRDKSHSTWKSLCLWLWKRLQCAGVQQGTGQSLSRLTPRKRNGNKGRQNSLSKDLCSDSATKEPRPCPKGSFKRACEETSLSEQPEAKRSREWKDHDQADCDARQGDFHIIHSTHKDQRDDEEADEVNSYARQADQVYIDLTQQERGEGDNDQPERNARKARQLHLELTRDEQEQEEADQAESISNQTASIHIDLSEDENSPQALNTKI
ncbi:uncharacterized protein LOC114958392 isoform X2 [Acropora millepora]|uniref:uncharacterized protein LOC114958392 isoform X2 n=1 Tax=Acropora millepora TaxID=45264 RepID=UPI001CF5F8F7|nr:uncharacterized protein LOC114958392 isoform X2 [Acropora millepora]